MRRITSFGTASVVPLVLFALGLGLIALNGCGPADGVEASPDATVIAVPTLTGAVISHLDCGADENGVRADGQLTNVTDPLAEFEFTVEFRDRIDRTYATAVVRTPPLAKDLVYVWEAVPNVPPAAGGHCEIADGPVVAQPVEERG